MKKYLSFSFFPACLLFSFSANAQLIASESFNYATGNITGQNGGTGWSSAWLTTTFNSSNNTVVAPGMTMPPQATGAGNQNHQNGADDRNFRYLDTTSALALSLMDNSGDPGATSAQNYHWGKGYGKDGTTIWFSFLFYRSNSTQGYGGMHLMYGMNLAFDQYGDKKSHQRFQFGADNSHANYMMSRTINGNPNLSGCGLTIQGSTPVNGTVHLLVHRIDFKAGTETGYMWVDPVSCVPPDTATANIKMYNICDFRFNAVNIGAGSSAQYEMDELRIGLTYNDVITCATEIDESEMMISREFISPNPNNGNFDLHLNTKKECHAQLMISDLLGRNILSQELSLSSGNNSIQVHGYSIPSGTYTATIKSEDGTSVNSSVIIQH
jgi:hypothetical protein